MSADKYPSILSHQIKAIVYIFTGVLVRLVKEGSFEDIHVVTRVRGPSFLRCLNMAPRNFFILVSLSHASPGSNKNGLVYLTLG